ncbi:hypothetical protein E3U55_06320 [Filobacillus milosensis]|uniref:Uncharacterized protein n=1 Tax=Filobacillus milosensis TaxID=94137 RepID=A0A4Y8IND6_9BACI|nr:hypothetical protein [Filobacillus milosensis]TFB22849.1 hypothetical protein E3U55_06320 [Filobacillus milosensis]
MYNAIVMLSFIFTYSVLIASIAISMKNRFHAGTVAFGLLALLPLLGLLSDMFITNVIDGGGPSNMSIGSMVGFVSTSFKILEGIAYAILVFGLYRLWRIRQA